MNKARFYIYIQPVISWRARYEMFCGKIAKAYSDVWKSFTYKIHEQSLL